MELVGVIRWQRNQASQRVMVEQDYLLLSVVSQCIPSRRWTSCLTMSTKACSFNPSKSFQSSLGVFTILSGKQASG
jgi:hypothetical protein